MQKYDTTHLILTINSTTKMPKIKEIYNKLTRQIYGNYNMYEITQHILLVQAQYMLPTSFHTSSHTARI